MKKKRYTQWLRFLLYKETLPPYIAVVLRSSLSHSLAPMFPIQPYRLGFCFIKLTVFEEVMVDVNVHVLTILLYCNVFIVASFNVNWLFHLWF